MLKLIARFQPGGNLPTAPSAKDRFKGANYVEDDDWLPYHYYRGETNEGEAFQWQNPFQKGKFPRTQRITVSGSLLRDLIGERPEIILGTNNDGDSIIIENPGRWLGSSQQSRVATNGDWLDRKYNYQSEEQKKEWEIMRRRWQEAYNAANK